MLTASAKAKGRNLQKWVRDLMLRLSCLSSDDIRSTSMGAGGEDLLLSPAARSIYPISIECKNVEKLNVWNAYDQASDNAGVWEPVLVFKKNRREPMVMVNAEFFFKCLTRSPDET